MHRLSLRAEDMIAQKVGAWTAVSNHPWLSIRVKELDNLATALDMAMWDAIGLMETGEDWKW